MPLFRNIASMIALLPMIVISLTVFVGCIIYSFVYSLTNSKLVPVMNYVGFDQYERLFKQRKWDVAVENIFIYGFVFTIGCLVIGFLLAVLIDQKIRGESLFRTIFLYPYAVCIAAVWQGAGFVMVLMLAGLRGIDEDIWKSLSIEGVAKWKSYLFVILPMLRPMVVTAIVLIAAGVVKVYDLILALTSGGPGYATTTPAMYVMENFFSRANLGQAFAASIIMFISVVCILAPWAFYEFYLRNKYAAN